MAYWVLAACALGRHLGFDAALTYNFNGYELAPRDRNAREEFFARRVKTHATWYRKTSEGACEAGAVKLANFIHYFKHYFAT